MFDLKRNADSQPETDSLGGMILESAIYDAMIKLAWLEKKPSGAIFANFIFDINNREYKENFCVASGDAKGNKVYYEKNGKEFDLPGFTQVFNICAITTNTSLDTIAKESEEDQIMVYDFASKADIEVTVPVMKKLIGKRVALGINKILENKRVPNATGAYVDSPESREINEIHTAFDPTTMLTVIERQNEVIEAAFHVKWTNKFAGKFVNKFKADVPPVETAMNADTPSVFS